MILKILISIASLVILAILYSLIKYYYISKANIIDDKNKITIDIKALHTDELVDLLHQSSLSDNERNILLHHLEKRDYKIYLKESKLLQENASFTQIIQEKKEDK